MESKAKMENKDIATNKKETKTDAEKQAEMDVADTPFGKTMDVESEEKAEAKVGKKTLDPLTKTDRYDDMKSAEMGRLGSNEDDSQEVTTGTGITQKAMKKVGDVNATSASKPKILKVDDKVKVEGDKVDGHVIVTETTYRERPIRGSDKTMKVLVYTKGALVPEAKLDALAK
jgi:hypothetical protein